MFGTGGFAWYGYLLHSRLMPEILFRQPPLAWPLDWFPNLRDDIGDEVNQKSGEAWNRLSPCPTSIRLPCKPLTNLSYEIELYLVLPFGPWHRSAAYRQSDRNASLSITRSCSSSLPGHLLHKSWRAHISTSSCERAWPFLPRGASI